MKRLLVRLSDPALQVSAYDIENFSDTDADGDSYQEPSLEKHRLRSRPWRIPQCAHGFSSFILVRLQQLI